MKKLLLFILLVSVFAGISSCKSYNENVSTHHKKSSSDYTKLEQAYKKYKGVKYRYGGTTSLGFDCSGFVQRVYAETFHINIPRTTRAMMKTGKKIGKGSLKIGDLVFFHPTRKYYHVGIYMGNGIFMHASSSRGITKSKMNLKYWQRSYVTARRIKH